MTVMEAGSEILKVDEVGRVRTPPEKREVMLAEYDRSAMTGAQFARFVGVRYSTLNVFRAKKTIATQNPVGRIGTVEEIASAMLWLGCSPIPFIPSGVHHGQRHHRRRRICRTIAEPTYTNDDYCNLDKPLRQFATSRPLARYGLLSSSPASANDRRREFDWDSIKIRVLLRVANGGNLSHNLKRSPHLARTWWETLISGTSAFSNAYWVKSPNFGLGIGPPATFRRSWDALNSITTPMAYVRAAEEWTRPASVASVGERAGVFRPAWRGFWREDVRRGCSPLREGAPRRSGIEGDALADEGDGNRVETYFKLDERFRIDGVLDAMNHLIRSDRTNRSELFFCKQVPRPLAGRRVDAHIGRSDQPGAA